LFEGKTQTGSVEAGQAEIASHIYKFQVSGVSFNAKSAIRNPKSQIE